MREILFRGQTRKKGQQVWMDGTPVDGQWVYGGIFQGTGDYSIIYGAEDEHFTGKDLGKYTVYTDTVGQYTGMKDINGKMIFEGDIVVLNEDVKKAFDVDDGEVKYGWGGFYIKEFSILNSLNALSSYDCILRGKVIGNIYDNPELLEVQND